MKISKYLRDILRTKFKQFCKHCTLHGVYYFYYSTKLWVHTIWTIIILTSLSLCCFLGHMIWDKFNIDPTLTVVETTHYSTADIQFPAVTVCDPEFVHGPNTQNITHLLSMRQYSFDQILEFYQSFTEIIDNKTYVPTQHVKKMHYLLEDFGYPLNNLLDIFKKPCEDLILECSWRSRPYNCAEMFRPVLTITGHCCQFDIPYFRENNSKNETSFTSGVQPTEALNIIVSGLKTSADGNITNDYVSLYVLDQKDRITLIDNAIILTPPAYFDVNVYPWTIDSSSHVKDLPLGSRKCVLDSDARLGTSYYKNCMTRHILRKVVNQCRCLPFDFTAAELDVEDYSNCNWERLVCVFQNIDKVQSDIRTVISDNKCYQRCDYVQYDTEVELIRDQRITRKVNEWHTRVSVHFSLTTCLKYRREVLYTWDQMLANLGGIFGLCLGGSIISIMEIIWFLMDLLITIIQESINKGKVAPKETTNKVFVISSNIQYVNKDFKVKKEYNAKKLRKYSSGPKYKFVN